MKLLVKKGKKVFSKMTREKGDIFFHKNNEQVLQDDKQSGDFCKRSFSLKKSTKCRETELSTNRPTNHRAHFKHPRIITTCCTTIKWSMARVDSRQLPSGTLTAIKVSFSIHRAALVIIRQGKKESSVFTFFLRFFCLRRHFVNF